MSDKPADNPSPKPDDATSPDVSKDTPPAWFTAFAEKVEGRMGDLGRDFARLRKSVKEPAASDSPPKEPAPADKPAPTVDIAAMFKLSELRASLPEKGRERIDSMLADDRPLAEIANTAELIRDLMADSKPGEPEKKPTEPTYGATPGQSTPTPVHPKTLSEWQKISREQPDLKNQLLDDPTFELPRK